MNENTLENTELTEQTEINPRDQQKPKKLFTYGHKNYPNQLKTQKNNNNNIQQLILKPSENEIERKITKQPYKILESQNLQDDFYLNLLDWSPQNYLAVGLKNEVFIWSGCTSTITQLCNLGLSDIVSSVSWSQRSNHIAIGDSLGNIRLYDTAKHKLVQIMPGHQSRVGSISWNGTLIASGSRDRNILVRDTRDGKNNIIQKYVGHKQEICGLKWSFDEQLLASGGNDNKLILWSLKKQGELSKFSQHSAAVKAIGFSPHQHNILASGGGTADRCIRFWNTQTLKQIDYLDTGSQVCNLMFSKNDNELVSTHGYSLNQIIVWKYPSMKKFKHQLDILKGFSIQQ
ncbi:hypothetical protein IMG5_199950 [Ichthyophthirius multifiliis]|uniref:CDC20/Fizzy WD40 domain-containing protein n=1 Tax=Ichthyophthirius multifiliis TaxID=5932 RepID=G0R5N6_ICHMU|nr:hypothetical protein IMG5_199950 [Ichthyophthirius multifiliis]EGR27209.1 hypothetical protein IMG5_199950 [Ichthyophthirius multifiliis]|eukprot:XP_004024093.1 hypothetical protein IMG5_199950 [Ichthyophthirius multifiliis]